MSITAEISQTFAKPSQTRTWIANAGEQNFVIDINEWCGIYNYCYTKVLTELSIFQFWCIITCVTWRSLTSKIVDRFNLAWNIPIVNVLQHHLTFYCKGKILQVIYIPARSKFIVVKVIFSFSILIIARVSKNWCQLQQKFLKHLRSPHKLELGLLMPANRIL